jgi:hypothetical protein
VSQPARVYVAVDWPASEYHGSKLASRYVLYDERTFALQYSSRNRGFFEYPGFYREDDVLIIFDFKWKDGVTTGDATGSITAEKLEVRYTDVMHEGDFEDGVYIRTP